MLKFSKIILYFIACIIIFLILARIYSGAYSRKAVAFEWVKPVNVYFIDSSKSNEFTCDAVSAVSRDVLNAETLGPGALEALFKGPTHEEAGLYFTEINQGVLVKKFRVEGKVAYVDLSSEFSKGVAGSCRVSAIRAQVEKTLIDLPDIDHVMISVEGKTESVLQP